MVTERRYKNALAVVEQYKKEQEELKQINLQNENITLDDNIHELCSRGLVGPKLTSILYYIWGWRDWNDIRVFSLRFFTDQTVSEFQHYRGIGKKTLAEFIQLMDAAGHKVK
jgi:hypothetical protein